MNDVTYGSGTAEDPWILKTPPLSSEFQVWKDEANDPPALVVQVGKTRLSYQLRALQDAHAMLADHGDWMPLGNADEGKPVTDGTLEAWARSPHNPVGGYYGLRKGYRGRFANYVGPTLELLGLAELEHNTRNNRIRAIDGEALPKRRVATDLVTAPLPARHMLKKITPSQFPAKACVSINQRLSA